MTRRPAVIWAIMKKDLIVLWPLLLLTYLAAGATYASMAATTRGLLHQAPPWIGTVVGLTPIAGVLAVLVFALRLAQQDPVPGVGQDWLTRPVSRFNLVAAKLLFLTLVLVAPPAVVAIANDLGQGRSLAEAFLGQASSVLIPLYLPILLAFAALTANLLEGLVALFAVFLFAVIWGVFAFLAGRVTSATGFDWVSSGLSTCMLIALGGFLLVIEYGRRKIWLARGVALVGVVLAAVINAYFPWNAAVAVQSAFAPAPKDLKIANDAMCVRMSPVVPAPLSTPFSQIATASFEVTGAPAHWKLTADRMQSPELKDLGMGPLLPTGLSGDVQSNIANVEGPRRVEKTFAVRLDAQGSPRPTEVTATLSLLKPDRTLTIPLDTRRRFHRGVGWCGVKAGSQGVRILDCQLFPSARHIDASVDGRDLSCRECVPGSYIPFHPFMYEMTWIIPARAKDRTATLRTYEYVGSTLQKTMISSAVQSDPARVCKDEKNDRLANPSTPIP